MLAIVVLSSALSTSALRFGVEISKRAERTRSPTCLRVGSHPHMAGFGTAGVAKKGEEATSTKSTKAPLSPKIQWDHFKKHRKAGIDATTVFARIAGTEAWFEVGDVSAAPPGAVAGAVQVQKRLILEHAVRVHPQLLPKARELEAGYAVDGTTQPLQKVEPIDAAEAGFEGRADASGRYGKSQAEIMEREASSLQAASKPAGGKGKGGFPGGGTGPAARKGPAGAGRGD